MKDKKTLKITSIIVAVLIAIFCITKILAAGTEFEDGEEWESTAWGYYVVTEDGEVIYSKEEYESKEGIYTSPEQLEGDVKDKGIYYDELAGKGSIFCIEQGQQLPSRHDENEVRKMGSGDSLGSQYHNGTIQSGLDPTTADALDANEKKALEKKESGNPEKALRGSYEYNYFKEGTYYSRSLKDSKGNINGTITTFATENDGRIRWSDGKEEIIDDEYERISWEDAYVLANSNPLADIEKNPAQLALWKLGKLNTGKKEVDSTDGDELYEKALLFGTYRQIKEEREEENGKSGPKLVDAEQDYKYKFAFGEQGNYLIAGPVKIDYGDLTITSADEKTELEVRQIENFIVWGTLADSDELKDITEYVKFTDEEGNELENMNETVGTAEGKGAGKKFPKTNEDFYIKVDYNSPIYTQVVAINSLEVSFKELDVRAVGYKLSEVIVHYTEWKSNNIMWQHCTVKHEYEEETTEYDSISGQWITTTETKTETETKDDHLKGNCSMGESPTCTSHDNCTITVTHEDITASPSEGILLEGETDSSTYAQMLFLLHKAELYWRRYKLVVLFGPENQNPPSDMTPPPYTPPATETPDIPHRTYIDIGGNVWVDAEETKEGTGTNGKYDEGTNDYPRKNVKVTLYFENGTMVKESDVAEWARKDFKNPTYTDEKGRYDFYQLPMDKKYYVEFTYDGMTYTTVDFLKDGTVSDYKVNSNKDIYKINSKAEEQKGKRQEFNNRFAEILGKGPSYYSGEKTTGETRSGEKLVYKTKIFDKNLQSRLLTTTDEKDVERLWNNDPNDREIGTARPGKEEEKSKYTGENYEMTVTTKDRELIYPFGEKEYIIWEAENNINKLEYLKHINLGLKRRPTADLSLAVDIKAGGTSIKDKTKLVIYRTNKKEEEMVMKMTEKDADGLINDTKVKAYTDGEIVQDIAGTDYYWLTNLNEIYTSNNPYGDGEQDSLNVYVLYKIIIANQSELSNTKATITSLVDYYSKGLTLPTEADQKRINKIFEPLGAKGSYSWVEGGNAVAWKKISDENGFNTIKADNLNLEIGGSGETKAIYLVLKVEEKDKLLDTNELKNITEIASYKFYDEKGPSGLVDCDSAPYNATPGKPETYEDDTDDAPVFKLDIKYQPKVIEGNVWEDLSGTPGVGDKKINGVKVELIEYAYKDGKIVGEVIRPGLTLKADNTIGVKTATNDRTGQDGEDGHYKFFVEGGNYAVKFTYGDETMLETNKKYNAQDYQASKAIYRPLSKIYTEDFNMAKATTDELISYLSSKGLVKIDDLRDMTQQPWETEEWGKTIENGHSNARDLAEYRIKAITNAIELTNGNSTILKTLNGEGGYGKGNVPEELTDYTYMESISDIVIMESNDLAQTSKIVNLALKERPMMSIDLEKDVTKIVIKTNDGRELINTDDESKLSNLQKLDGIQRVFMNMDTKSMEGATIDIDYKLTVKNSAGTDNSDRLSNYLYLTGENARSAPTSEKYIVDKGEDFSNLMTILNNKKYFNGAIKTIDDELPIRANEIYDYVNINLEFRADDNKNDAGKEVWEKIYDNEKNKEEIAVDEQELKKYVTEDVITQLSKDKRKVTKVIRTTVDAENEKTNLYTTEENSEAEILVHLGITLSEDINDDNPDAFVYSNCAEIIQIFSGAGRRDYDIIPGNYVPYEDPKEPDEKWTGTSTVTPPLGENRAVYIVLPVISIGIVIIGIILIKKKVLKK